MSVSSSLSKVAKKLTDTIKSLVLAILPGRNIRKIPRSVATQPINVEGSQKSAEVLGLIYRLIVRARSDKLLHEEEMKNLAEGRQLAEEKQYDELIKALTIKRPRKFIFKKPEEQKPAPTPSAPPSVTPPATKPSASPAPVTAPKPSAPTPPPRVNTPTQTPSTVTKLPAKPFVGLAVGAGLAAMSTSLIAKEEGYAKKAYVDAQGVSVGYGHQIQPEEYKQGFIQVGDERVEIKGNRGLETVITKPQAEKLLKIDIPKYENAARLPLGASWNKLNDTQKAALTSYAYNTGSTQSLVKAGLKEAIDSDDMREAARIIRERGIKTSEGKYLAVLDERRHREAALFESGVSETTKPVTTPAKPGSNIEQSSRENKTLRESLNNLTNIFVNNNNVNTSTQVQNNQHSEAEYDDRPAFKRK